jgi:AcrR family transcriptional regulator
MPRTSEQNQKLRAQSMRRLLAAARTTFVRLGYDRATTRDIAREAGVAHGLLYNYFPSKDELLVAVFREGVGDVAEALGAGTGAGTPADQLEQIIRRSFEIVQERREFWMLSHMLRFQPRTAALTEELSTWTRAVRAQLEQLLRAVGHPDAPALSHVLFAAIDGAAQHYALDPEQYALQPVVECLVTHFCRPPASSTSALQARRDTAQQSRADGGTSRQRPARAKKPPTPEPTPTRTPRKPRGPRRT